MNFISKKVVMKANSINLVVIVASINYFILHHIAGKTFSPAAFASDSGWGSIWTVLFILAGQATVLWLLFNAKSKQEAFDWGLLLYIYQVYCFREADLHRFAEDWHNITNIKFYTRSAAPMELKIICVLIFTLFGLAGLYLLGKYFIKLVKLFFEGEPFAVAFALWGGCLLVSQILDRAKFFNGARMPIVKNIEEMLELTAALFALLAMVQYIQYKFKLEKKNICISAGANKDCE